jgi:hypothetical protein
MTTIRCMGMFMRTDEGMGSFLNGVLIGLAIVGPVAVLDMTELGFVWTLMLWAALALAGAAMHWMRRGHRQSGGANRSHRDE